MKDHEKVGETDEQTDEKIEDIIIEEKKEIFNCIWLNEKQNNCSFQK